MFTAEDFLEQINNILGIVNGVLVAIAGISIIVGGIGIVNSMYTSVLERTKEIGIMKAVGARNFDIAMIFIVEAGILGLIGGLLGVALGLGIAYIVQAVAANLGFQLLKVQISLGLVLFGLSFAFVIGVVSGLLPALNAAKLKPADSLRY